EFRAGVDVVAAEPPRTVRGEVHRPCPGGVVLEQCRAAVTRCCVDDVSEIRRGFPREVVPLVVPARYTQIRCAESSGAVAVEVQPVSVERERWLPVVERRVDRGPQVLRRLPRRVDARTL